MVLVYETGINGLFHQLFLGSQEIYMNDGYPVGRRSSGILPLSVYSENRLKAAT